MAMVFYVIVGHGADGLATVMVRDELQKMWGVSTEEMYNFALRNTQRMCKGTVRSMSSVLTEIMSERMDAESVSEFFDLYIEDGDLPMYIATNEDKLNGAISIFYTGLLKEVAERLDSNLFIQAASMRLY
ncbi:MAG: hypothetical protein GX235_03725 [Clostridiales bacterium]|nr:hypothetical protein [Clostridiales bacterium]